MTDKKCKIPKIIHYVWVGNKPKPKIVEQCIESWKRYCPDYEIMEWGNDILKELDCDFLKEAMSAKMYAFAADYIRMHVLYKYGGIYLDTDTELKANIDEFLDNDFFIGQEKYQDLVLISAGLIGCVKEHKIIKDMLETYNHSHFLNSNGKQDLTVITLRLYNYFKEKYGMQNIEKREPQNITTGCMLYPYWYFCNPEEGKISYAKHHYCASWKKKKPFKFLETIFSIKNTKDKKHKLITILNIKIKIKCNKIKANEKLIFVHRKDTDNIGDLSCAPYLYFKFEPYNVIDILEFKKKLKLKNKTIIVGGGGLLQDFFQKSINNLIKLSKNNNIIFWGVGFDFRANKRIFDDRNLRKIKNISIRDYNSGYNYVPCVSCMSELFDTYKDAEIQDNIRVYLHSDFLVEELKNYPILINNANSMEVVIKFLSGANIIITNSFHGAYWGTLLNKKVIVIPWIENGIILFPEKFLKLKYKPVFCDNIAKINECFKEAINYPEALEESRKCNIDFYKNYVN